MCSMNHPNWVTFEDEGSPVSSPPKQPQTSSSTPRSLPRPNGLKLVLPPLGDQSWSFTGALESPQVHSGLNGSNCVPSNTPMCTPVRETPTGASPFNFGPRGQPDLFCSASSSPSTVLSSSGLGQSSTNPTSENSSPFPLFQDDPGHCNPFWGGDPTSHNAESGSSSSDSESGSSLPRFFIRTKEGYEPPPAAHLQSSYSYICHKLERLRAVGDAEEEEEEEAEEDSTRTEPSVEEERDEGRTAGKSLLFVPQGLFRSQRRHGWPLMLRIPEKKNRMSSRQWGPIYLHLLPGGVLQLYYEKGLEKPFKEFQLQPQCRLSGPKLESYGEPRKIHTVKIEHVTHTERKRYHPKPDVTHEAEVEQLLKFGTTDNSDMEDLMVALEEELLRLPPPQQPRKHYEEQEMSLQIADDVWVKLDKDGATLERAAVTRIHCLAFLNAPGECFMALNDEKLLLRDSSYGSEGEDSVWMEIADCHFHSCVKEDEFHNSRLVKFSPPDACRVELMRYKTRSFGCSDLPFSMKALVTVQGAYVELQAFLNMSSSFPSVGVAAECQPLCENVMIRVPVPGDWIKVSRTVSLLRQRSLKSRMNRNTCLGSVNMPESHPVMQVSVGTVKYENVYGAIVWRIDRLPAKNMALNHPHSFSCKLELGSDQEIPTDWYPFATVEYDVADVVVSQTRVRSLGTESDIQPQKHVSSRAYYHCQCKLYLSVIDDVIENVRETFLDEGVEEGVLNELRQLWVSRVMQSKAVEGFRKDTVNPSKFVLQLPANYTQTLQKQPASIILPPGQNVQNFTAKASSAGAIATFSLPPGVTYPVHIPAGVTLQTASGHFYKVNVPVVVTQAPRANRVFPQPAAQQQQAPPAPPKPQPAPGKAHTTTITITTTRQAPIQTSNKMAALPTSTAPVPQPNGSATQAGQQPQNPQKPQKPQKPPAPVGQSLAAPVPHPAPLPPVPLQPAVPLQPPVPPQAVPESPGDFTLDGIEFSPHGLEAPFTPSPGVHIKQEQGPPPIGSKAGEGIGAAVDTPDKEVKEEAPDGLPVSDGTAFSSLGSQLDEAIKMELMRDFDYNGLEDIVQLDGACDGTSDEEEVDIGGPVGENDFLGMISADALHVLEEEGGTDDSSTSGSDMEKDEEVIEEQDPLNSGDDVSEQDIPDLFDTDNVIVCQYEKIHRSKNRWKFNLKDGVMCYGGKDYVFSRAIGEAEW
ncbi:stonin-1 [Clupea harengus]|uniref:Stonin-1 n=1 Tax=Clupea harengus TaxID=7950 RepID=A0A6P8G5M3_CLUHA|nr:stonin-1 [Clupea harengus]